MVLFKRYTSVEPFRISLLGFCLYGINNRRLVRNTLDQFRFSTFFILFLPYPFILVLWITFDLARFGLWYRPLLARILGLGGLGALVAIPMGLVIRLCLMSFLRF